MAISTTYTKRQEQLGKSQTPTTSATPYNGMQGVSQNTANNLGNYQGGYKPSDQTQAAQQQLAQTQAAKPQSYNSKYGPALDNILQQIQNPSKFKYEFNGDELFKYYADLYSQYGKQASMDAMGQAAALTGGYGNSYGQQVADQAYQQKMLALYDRGMDLRDRAYQQHQDELGNQQNIYNILAGQDQADYGKYRDTVGDWQAQLEYDTGRADAERNFDYNQYETDLGYWTDLAGQEAALAEQQRGTNLDEAYRRDQQNLDEAYRRDTLSEQIRSTNLDEAYRRDQQSLDEAYRGDTLQQSKDEFQATNDLDWEKLRQNQAQFDANLTEEQRQYNRNVAIDYVAQILANGQIPSNELLVAAGLSRPDAEKMIAAAQGSGGSGSGNGSGNGNGEGNGYDLDEQGNVKATAQTTSSIADMIRSLNGSTANTGNSTGNSTRTTANVTGTIDSSGAGKTSVSQDISGLKKKTKKTNADILNDL